MIDYHRLPRNDVLCLDMKSFFASVEAVRLGLDPLKDFIVVVGDKNRSGSVVLAASPMMKEQYGVKTGSRLYEVPKYDKRIHIVEANMSDYLKTSVAITRLLNQFAPLEAIHVYSIDEAWICVNGTQRLFGTRWQVAEKIREAIKEKFGLPCSIGIGPNKFLAKVILDIEAKKKGIAECQYEDVPKKLWPQPIGDIWGIGPRMERHLHGMGIRTLGHLAHFPLERLKNRFGVIGEQLYYHAHGIDLSPCMIEENLPAPKGIGHGITLLRDYIHIDEIKTVLLEISEEVAMRARKARVAGKTVSLHIGYSRMEGGGGFQRFRTIDTPTNITMDIYQTCLQLFQENFDGRIVRSVSISLSKLVPDTVLQMSLFDNLVKKRALGYVMDEIRAKYGATAILRAKSYTLGGTAIQRSQLIGGHKA
jgi:DNA polymerase V